MDFKGLAGNATGKHFERLVEKREGKIQKLREGNTVL